MIVCLCYAVCVKEIAELIKEGKTIEEILSETGAGMGCGSCCDCVDNMVKDMRKTDDRK